MITIAAEVGWRDYLRRSFGSRPTAKVRHFAPPSNAISGELSRVAKEPTLFALHDQLDRVALLPNDWDGHGSVRPDALAIENSRQFLEEAYRQSEAAEGWQAPHISSSEDGEIVFEWWNGNRKLTVYVGPRERTYIKSWGPHVMNDMDDGALPEDGISSLWTWLSE